MCVSSVALVKPVWRCSCTFIVKQLAGNHADFSRDIKHFVAQTGNCSARSLGHWSKPLNQQCARQKQTPGALLLHAQRCHQVFLRTEDKVGSVKRRNCFLFCKLWQSVLLFLKKYLQRRHHLTKGIYYKQQVWQLYLWVCRVFPVDDVVVQFVHFLPHGAVVSGQRVGDVDIQVASCNCKSHIPRRAQSSWWEILEKISDPTNRFRVVSFSPFILSFSSNNLIWHMLLQCTHLFPVFCGDWTQ